MSEISVLRPKSIEVLSKVLIDLGSDIDDDSIEVTRLDSLTNDTYLIDTSSNKLILKEYREGTEKYIDRTAEEYLMRNDPNEKVYYYNLKDGLSITQYHFDHKIFGLYDIKTTWKDRILIKLIDRVHTLPVDEISYMKFDVLQNILKYKNLVASLDFSDIKLWKLGENYNKLCNIHDTIIDMAEIISSEKTPKCMCHNDLVPNNILLYNQNNKKMKLIDYEYAGINDPAWDYASLVLELYNPVIYYQATCRCKLIRELSTYYYDTDYYLGVRMIICMLLQDYMWSLWTILQIDSGRVDFDQYLDYFNTRSDRVVRQLHDCDQSIRYFYRLYGKKSSSK